MQERPKDAALIGLDRPLPYPGNWQCFEANYFRHIKLATKFHLKINTSS